jgi:hypothetical protein
MSEEDIKWQYYVTSTGALWLTYSYILQLTMTGVQILTPDTREVADSFPFNSLIQVESGDDDECSFKLHFVPGHSIRSLSVISSHNQSSAHLERSTSTLLLLDAPRAPDYTGASAGANISSITEAALNSGNITSLTFSSLHRTELLCRLLECREKCLGKQEELVSHTPQHLSLVSLPNSNRDVELEANLAIAGRTEGDMNLSADPILSSAESVPLSSTPTTAKPAVYSGALYRVRRHRKNNRLQEAFLTVTPYGLVELQGTLDCTVPRRLYSFHLMCEIAYLTTTPTLTFLFGRTEWNPAERVRVREATARTNHTRKRKLYSLCSAFELPLLIRDVVLALRGIGLPSPPHQHPASLLSPVRTNNISAVSATAADRGHAGSATREEKAAVVHPPYVILQNDQFTVEELCRQRDVKARQNDREGVAGLGALATFDVTKFHKILQLGRVRSQSDFQHQPLYQQLARPQSRQLALSEQWVVENDSSGFAMVSACEL